MYITKYVLVVYYRLYGVKYMVLEIIPVGMAEIQTDGEDEHPFDVAKDVCEDVNERLAETNGAISAMGMSGAIGYHHFVATGETDPEYLWKVALIQALEETVFEMTYVDAPNPRDARDQLERDLERSFDPFTAETVAEQFEENLRDLIDSQEEIGSSAGAVPGDD